MKNRLNHSPENDMFPIVETQEEQKTQLNNFEDNTEEMQEMRQLQTTIDESEEMATWRALDQAASQQNGSETPLPKKNTTGIPDDLKARLESLSGISLAM